MMVNCLASAGYVLGMRKRIKVTNFKVGHDLAELSHLLHLTISFLCPTGLGLYVLQQPSLHSCSRNFLHSV